jgi:hypothetical protein
VLRAFRRATGHLAPRQDAVWGEGEGEAMVPIGQHMANLRRTGGLGKNTERAAARAAQLDAIDPDRNCPWPLDWQRHYRHLAADAPGGLIPDIASGVHMGAVALLLTEPTCTAGCCGARTSPCAAKATG